MKHTLAAASLGIAFGVLAMASVASADDDRTVRTETTTTYTGTVSEINPSTSTMILRSSPTAAPVTYTYSNETTFVDAAGNVVSYEAIRNSPVRVEYTTDGGRTIVRRVIQTGPATMVPGAPTMAVPAPPSAAPMAVPAPSAPSPGSVIQERTIRTEREDD